MKPENITNYLYDQEVLQWQAYNPGYVDAPRLPWSALVESINCRRADWKSAVDLQIFASLIRRSLASK